ncbi:mechanosensitive ion channel domain-containing protein [Frateuria sp. Soil773]|uniref:mechanosensitive ion channel family protein n=1 Tax=Frateuria sp. Soil773 TaxID=1736407 RepID=UPI0009E769C7|nr:mechanosensitive ion channel domain-containing protein [Frateuria sp. Soil773]
MADRFAVSWSHDVWLRLGVAVLVALVLALLLRALAYGVLRRLARRRPFAADLLKRTSAPMEWLIPLLMLAVALRVMPGADALPAAVLLRHLLLVALLAAATWLAIRCVGALERVAMRHYPMDVADNLLARRVLTQVRVLGRTADILLATIGVAAILLTIPGVRQLGASLLASAGVAGLALGLAARPVLSNLIAGLQIAMTQPIRLDDVVIIENEWGRVEEITGSYVVVRIWDERRLVVPLNWFIEHPFQNWTRRTARLIGTVFLWLDYRTPLAPLREELARLCREAPEWDGRVCVLQVTDANERAMQLRALVSSADSGRNWDLRCRVREGLLAFVQARYPEALPRWRGEFPRAPSGGAGGPGPAAYGPPAP